LAAPRICSVLNCNKPVSHRGFCSAHYQRWLKYGDPQGGGTFKGEPMRFLQETVLLFDEDVCLDWPYHCDSYGYAQLWISSVKGHRLVSRIVCEALNGEPPTPSHEAAHSCGRGNQGCVAPRHLVWKTRTENQSDRLIHGTHSRGEKSGSNKLSPDEVRLIRALNGKMFRADIAKQFHVGKTTVTNIINRKKWAWLD